MQSLLPVHAAAVSPVKVPIEDEVFHSRPCLTRVKSCAMGGPLPRLCCRSPRLQPLWAGTYQIFGLLREVVPRDREPCDNSEVRERTQPGFDQNYKGMFLIRVIVTPNPKTLLGELG
jgi:hypothetical protein